MIRAKGTLRNLETLIKKGENPEGFTAQTANGTARTFGTGHNRKDWETTNEWPQDREGGTWQGGRNTRWGE